MSSSASTRPTVEVYLWEPFSQCLRGICKGQGKPSLNRHLLLALKVTAPPIGPSLAVSLAVWLHHPGRGGQDERKTVGGHPSMSVSNYHSTNHRAGSIESQDRGEETRGDQPRDGGITDQYMWMDFVILKTCCQRKSTTTRYSGWSWRSLERLRQLVRN